jgi:4-diphosphocytidyl-2-C-methyl-D-erythritol kinase
MLEKKKTFFSPAKINLFFLVLYPRNDGYHEIASLLQTISLGDVLSFSLSSQDYFTTTEKTLSTDSSNLVIKALDLFRKKTSLTAPISIHLDKRIPMEAGLGGGSSNAATTLWALKELFELSISVEELQEWGSFLGSDVPFFFSSGTAFCTGRGEKVHNVKIPSFPLWIAKPPFGLSTKKVYEHFRDASKPLQKTSENLKNLLILGKTDSKNQNIQEILDKWSSGSHVCYNDLESSACHLMPQIEEFRKKLQEAGFSQVTMTGSGSAFFCFGQKKKNIDCGNLIFSQTIQRNESAWYNVSES